MLFLNYLAYCLIFFFTGAKYKDDCPVEPFIPIYLIVGGSFGMLKTIIVLCQRARTHEDDIDMDEDQSMSTKFIDGVLNLFLFTWFIAGNIWVYSKYRPNPSPPPSDPLNYCNPTLYLFAFWVITASYILMGSICFCICCLGVCASCTAFFVTAKDWRWQCERSLVFNVWTLGVTIVNLFKLWWRYKCFFVESMNLITHHIRLLDYLHLSVDCWL